MKIIDQEKNELLQGHNDDAIVVASSGDVFADLGIELDEVGRLKIDLACAINEEIRLRGFTQVQAAKIMDVDQAKVSKIIRGNLDGFSIGRLLKYLMALDIHLDLYASAKTESSSPSRLTFHPCNTAFG